MGGPAGQVRPACRGMAWHGTGARGRLGASHPSPMYSVRSQESSSKVTKIMQTEITLGVIVRRLAEPYPTIIRGEMPCTIQTCDSLTGEVSFMMQEEQLEIPLLTPLLPRFEVVVDLNVSDRGGNNGVCNRWFEYSYPNHMRIDNFGCAAHCSHDSVENGLKAFRSFTSGAIAFALAQRLLGAEGSLKGDIVETLISKARPRTQTHPPQPGSDLFRIRSAIFDLLFNADDDGIAHRIEFEGLFQGDLLSDRIDLFIPEQLDDDECCRCSV